MKKFLKKFLIPTLLAFFLITPTAYAAINIVPNGGTGVGTITGLIKGNGTSPFTAITDSSGLAGVLSDETGSSFGGLSVFNFNPTILGAYINGLLLVGNANTSGGEIRFYEDGDNGVNYKAFKAPDSIGSDSTCQLANLTAFIPDSCVGNGVDDTGGGVSDADYGDIVVTGGGTTWDIDGGVVGTTELANDGVTFGKIQNITSDRLLGRDTAGSGDTEEITVGGGLEFTGSAGIQRSALTGDVTASAGSNSTTIASNSVALTTDTTGNYVADVAGTSNEVSVSHTPSEGSTATISLPATIDLGGKTSFEIPNGASPTVDAFGEIAGDNDLWAASRGAPVFFDGTASTALVNVLVSDAPSNGQVPKWNTGGTITWEDDSTGGLGTGDIDAVGNCSTASCFTGVSGSSLTFDNVGGDGVLSYDGTVFDIDKPLTLGTAGVRLTGDGDGAITLLGQGNGSDEDLTFNLDDVSNTIGLSSSTSLDKWNFGAIHPQFNDLNYLADANGNELLILDTVTSAVNELTLANAATGNDPTLSVTGGDSNISMSFQTKGTGVYRFLATSSGPTDIRWREDTDNGTNYNSLIAPASMASDLVQTLPATTGTLLNDNNTVTVTNKTIASSNNVVDSCLVVAVTDDFSNLVAGTAKITFRMPYAMTLTSVRMSLVTAATGGTLATVDINEGGTTILSTKLTTDASEKTSTTAATAAVISDSSLADDSEMTVDIDAIGSTLPGNGLKIQLCGTI